ncbi:MAG TPA: hypothetical protein VE136_10420 [Anaerolineales bacterium]|nr:hypothetical protein [Anaerolineales bacterium]
MMKNPQIAGVVLIVGLVLVLVAAFAGPPRLYQDPDSDNRLQIIADYPGRWLASNLFFILAGVVTAVGLGLFSLHLRASISGWITGLAAAGYTLGTIAWMVLMAGRAVNPEPYFRNYTFSPLTVALLWLILVGLLLYGVAFLQAGYPGWLGFGTIAGTGLIGAAALFFPNQFYASFPPQILYLFTLVSGIVMLRQ